MWSVMGDWSVNSLHPTMYGQLMTLMQKEILVAANDARHNAV